MAKDNGEEYLEKLLGKVNGDFSDDDFLKDIDEDFPELNDQKFMEEFAKDVDKVVVEDFLDKAENSDDSIIDDLKAELEADGVNEQINFEDSRDLSFPEDMDFDIPFDNQDSSDAIDDYDMEGFNLDNLMNEALAGATIENYENELNSEEINEELTISEDNRSDLDIPEDNQSGLDIPDDNQEELDIPELGLPDVSEELSNLFDKMEEVDSQAFTNKNVNLDVLGDGVMSDLSDIDEMIMSELGEDDNGMSLSEEATAMNEMLLNNDELGLDLFDGLEGLSMDTDNMSADDILGELGFSSDVDTDDTEEEKPAAKGLKGFVNSVLESAQPEEDTEDPAAKKERKKKEKEEKKKAKEEKKKAKAEKKAAKPKKEKKQKKEKKPEPKGKPLPKLKTFLILVLAVSIIVLFFIGTNYFGYQMNISNVKQLYNNGQYIEAYSQIKGIDVKESDAKLKNEITIISKLYKYLDSYPRIVDLEMYPEALCELLDAVKAYDYYIDDAKEIGVEGLYNSFLGKIEEKLKSDFKIDLKKAREINSYKEEVPYSRAVYDIVDAIYKPKDKDV